MNQLSQYINAGLLTEIEDMKLKESIAKTVTQDYISDLQYALTARDRELDEYRAELVKADRRIVDLVDEFNYLVGEMDTLMVDHKSVLKEFAAKQRHVVAAFTRLHSIAVGAPVNDAHARAAA